MKIALQYPAVGVVPLVHRPGRQAGSLAGCFVCCLSAEEIVAHGRSQTVEAVVGAFADLAGVVVPDEAPGERRLEDVVAERVLDDFALEVDGEDERSLGSYTLKG